ncbi:DUF4145 domain-containing protein [Bifidobacterium sp. W8106]|uniref:DUF4145 domain-containing protein n=1 Tax=Bifidobacterium TaxID=1678 RepID=UPI0009DE96D9|nr:MULTISPECIES: DUF4145 domain-containing protein [Bifidobacterium]MBI0141913.1 DUF4145 domain-containing protein [Bifidobacterium choladohabitans]MBI0147068.1 DUF4145 domain-containing protein [Bifidobacterium sp. W8104]
MASRICWHCGRFSHMTPQGSLISGDLNNAPVYAEVWFAIFKCDSCGYATLGMIDYNFSLSDVDVSQAQEDFLNDSEEIKWIPEAAVGMEYEDVPTEIASVASEAYSCCSISAYRSAVLMARTVLEATAKDKGVTSGSLYEKIDELAAKTIITRQLAEEAHEIRLLGNDMAHGDLNTPVSKEDAEEILGFLDSVLDYVYQQPIAIERRKKVREQRKLSKK